MKKILLLDTGKEWGGGTNSMIELLKRIDRTRFSVTALFYVNYKKGADSDLKTELANIDIPLEIIDAQRQSLFIKVAKEITRGVLTPFPKLRQKALHKIERIWRINPQAKKIAARLINGNFDILYMNNQPSSNLEGYLAGEIAKVSVVQHCRTTASVNSMEVKIANEIAHKIICVSADVKAALIQQGITPSLCEIVYNGIDLNQIIPEPILLPAIPQGAFIIGIIGSLLPRKSQAHLIDAFSKLIAHETIPLFLLIIGDGSERHQLEIIAKKLNINDKVVFAGFQNNVLQYLKIVDVVALTSDSEGLPRVLLEAMLLEKPIIASNVSGTRELVTHNENGFLYPYGDIKTLANHLQALVENESLRIKMGQAGKERVLRDFSIEQYVKGVESVLWECA